MILTQPCLSLCCPQLIFSAFKTLTNQTVTVELKNDVAVTGTLKSVDQFLNFRIDDLKVVEGDEERWPHFVSVTLPNVCCSKRSWTSR